MLPPVFIGGCERSGTTLLGAMLGSHSTCIALPETPFKIKLLRDGARGRDVSFDSRVAFREILGNWHFKIWRTETHRWPAISDAEVESPSALLDWIALQYAKERGRAGIQRWVDHTPNNIRYIMLLLDRFPGARFLNVVRDGRAVAASLLPLDWGPNSIYDVSSWWLSRVAQGLAAEEVFGPETFLRIRFEDLVREPRVELERICTFLGLKFEETMLSGKGFDVPPFTISQHSLVGSPPLTHRVDAWRDDLSQRQIEVFEARTGDVLPCLGYSHVFSEGARAPGTLELGWMLVAGQFRGQVINRMRRWVRRLKST